MKCPRCGQTLVVRKVPVPSGRLVDVVFCESGCRGLWVDEADIRAGLAASTSEELEKLQGDDEASRWQFLEVDVEHPRPTLNLDQPVCCPRCGAEMFRYRWNATSPAMLDQCRAGHGIWIDGGEVALMREYLRNEEGRVVAPQRREREIHPTLPRDSAPSSFLEWLGLLLSRDSW